jgi:hypothetical protein
LGRRGFDELQVSVPEALLLNLYVSYYWRGCGVPAFSSKPANQLVCENARASQVCAAHILVYYPTPHHKLAVMPYQRTCRTVAQLCLHRRCLGCQYTKLVLKNRSPGSKAPILKHMRMSGRESSCGQNPAQADQVLPKEGIHYLLFQKLRAVTHNEKC